MTDPYTMGPFEPLHIDMINRMISTIKRGWCQEHLAKDMAGNSVAIRSKDAELHCLLGAAFKSEWSFVVRFDPKPVYDLLRVLIADKMRVYRPKGSEHLQFMPDRVIEIWNDMADRTQEDVLALLQDALVIVRGNQRNERKVLSAEIVDILSNAKSVEVREPV